MILADTSVWVEHLRTGVPALARLLDAENILAHPFVIGELALGNLGQRRVVLEGLANLPRASLATDDEVLSFIDGHRLSGRGIGYVDCHLLAAVRLTAGSSLWTLDKRLHAVADELALARV